MILKQPLISQRLMLLGCSFILVAAPLDLQPISLSGTLVIIVPTKEGLIAAADSRSSAGKSFCDGTYKIIHLSKPARCIATVTGTGIFVANPGPEVKDLCEYVKRAPRLLDIEQVVKSSVEKAADDIAALDIEDVASSCIDSLKKFASANPLAIKPFAGRELFSVVLAQYTATDRTAVIRSFTIRVSPSARDYEIVDVVRFAFAPNSPRDYAAFGETDYLNETVFGGVGRAYITPATVAFLRDDNKTVSQTSLEEAIAVSNNIIEATSKATTLIPAPSGIGGPVHLVLLGSDNEPRRLQ